jgi:hypothetical protein
MAVPKNSKQFLRRIIMDLMYTAVYEQDHFGLGVPEGFTTENRPLTSEYKKILEDYNLEDGYAFQQQYISVKNLSE